VYTNSLSEIIAAERQFAAQQQQATISSADRRSADAQSLLSVSPSEPGVGNNLSSYPSIEDTGSVGDLVDRVKPKHNRLRAVTSPLSPTSSLPNLQPQHDNIPADSSILRRGQLRKEKLSSQSDSSPLGSLPAVTEGDSLTTSPSAHSESLSLLVVVELRIVARRR